MAALVLGVAGAVVGGVFGGPVGAAVGQLVGTMIGNLIDPPKVEGPRLDDLKLQRSTYGAFIPILYGAENRIAGNVIWQTDLEEHKQKSGGKGGPQVTTYTYSASWAILLCAGPILGISRMWADGRLISTTGEPTDDLPFVLYLGTEDQLPDPTIEAEEGAGEVPAHRGYAYIVFTDVYLTDYGNRIFQIEVEVQASGEGHLERVCLFDDPLPTSLYTGWNGAIVGTAIDGNALVVYDYQEDSPYSLYTESRYSLITGELLEAKPTMNVDNNGGSLTTWRVSSNSDIAVGIARGTGGTPFDARWYRAGLPDEFISPPLGEEGYSNAYFYAVSNRPFLYKEFIYAPATAGSGPTAHVRVYKWGIRPSSNMPAGVAEDDYFDYTNYSVFNPPGANTTSGGSVVITIDDEGYLYVLGPGSSSANCELMKVDISDMSLVWQRVVTHGSDLLGDGTNEGITSAAINAGGFTVFRGLLAIWGTGETAVAGQLFQLTDSGVMPWLDNCEEPIGSTYTGWNSLPGGYIVTNLGIMRIAALEILGNIVADISERCGLSAAQYDVTDLPDGVRGFRLAALMTGKNALEPLRQAYFFDGAEVDDQVLFVHRDHAVVAEIPEEDLAAHEFGATMPPLIEITRIPDAEIPRKIDITYINPDADYQPGVQYAARQTSQSLLDVSLSFPITFNDDEARERANAILFSAWIEREPAKFWTSRKWEALVPTDIVEVQGRRLRIVDKQSSVKGVIEFRGVPSKAIVFTQVTGGGVGGGFVPQLPGSTTKVLTELVLLDIDLLSPDDSQYGFYAAMAPASSGSWSGASLYKSLDDGVSYIEVASTGTASTIGHATTALANFTGGVGSSPSSGAPIGGGALGLPETRVLAGQSPETVYTMQVAQDCDVTVAASSGGVPIWVAHGQNSTNWIAYGAGVAYPPLWVLAGDYFSWKFGGSNPQDMRPQSQPHGALGVAAGGGTSTPGTDNTSTVEVQLHDLTQTLESTNDTGLANGMNMAALRSGDLWEIFQFKTATLIGDGLYELSNLLRGVNGTTAFMAGHAIDDDFVMLDSVVNVPAPASELNFPFLYKAVTFGRTLASASAVEFTNTGDLANGGGNGGGAGGTGAAATIPDFVGDNPGSPYVTPARGLVPAPMVGYGANEYVLICTLDDVTGSYWGIPSWAVTGSGSPVGSPSVGASLAVQEEGVTVVSSASTLNVVGTPGTVTNVAGVATLTITPALIVLTPAYAATLTVDLTNYSAYAHVQVDVGALTGNIALNITNGTNAQKVNIRLLQDGTGGRTISFGANLTASSDLPVPLLSPAANAVDYLFYQWDGTSSKARLLAYNRGFA